MAILPLTDDDLLHRQRRRRDAPAAAYRVNSGGLRTSARAWPPGLLEPQLRALLATIGLTRTHLVSVRASAAGPETAAAEQALNDSFAVA